MKPGLRSVKSEGGAGLPVSGKPAFLVAGKLTRPHGVRGEMLMEIHTDFPDRLKSGSQVFLGEHHKPHMIRSARGHSVGLIVAFDGYTNPEMAGQLRNQLVYVPSDNLPPLPEGDYYHHQLLGLRVKTTQDEELGEVEQILQTGANDVVLVRAHSGGEILIPYIDEVVREIDLDKGQITIELLPGLLPE